MKRRIWLAGYLPALVGLAFAASAAWAQAPAPKPPVVVAVRVSEETLTPEQAFHGEIMPPRRSVVGSAVEGRVERVYVKAGDEVQRLTEGDPPREVGQPLAQILTETIKIELAEAQAELELRRHELDEMKNPARGEEIAQAEAQAEATKARRAYSQARHDRMETLFRQSRTVSQEEFDLSLAAATAAEQEHKSALAALEITRKGARAEKIAQAEARLAMQTEAVNRLNDRIRKYTVRAPFHGFVVEKFTEVGQWIKAGDPVVEIVELDPVEVHVHVPESFIAFIREKQEVRLTVGAVPDREFTGRITQVVPLADLRSRSFPVKIELANEKNEAGGVLLKAGLTARVWLPSGRPQTGVAVPKDAVVLGEARPAIVVAVPGAAEGVATVRKEYVTLGAAAGDRFLVSGNIQPNDLVVVEGNERLRPGMPVTVQVKK